LRCRDTLAPVGDLTRVYMCGGDLGYSHRMRMRNMLGCCTHLINIILKLRNF